MTKKIEVKKVNHYGKWVDTKHPVTGVLSANNLNWECVSEICLTCEAVYNDKSVSEEDKDFLECNSDHDKIFGDWTYNTKTKKYSINKRGEEGFAAIIRESEIQIVYSKTIAKNCGLCSPCFPGQVDLDSEGEFKGYTLPSCYIE